MNHAAQNLFSFCQVIELKSGQRTGVIGLHIVLVNAQRQPKFGIGFTCIAGLQMLHPPLKMRQQNW